MLIDALVLAGGRSARLGGEPKAALRFQGRSLLQIAVDAAAQARRIVVVGDPRVLGQLTASAHDQKLAFAREDPPFGGPAAGLGAGLEVLRRLEPQTSAFTIVIGCDMPLVGLAVDQLLVALRSSSVNDGESDGVIGMSNGQLQPLAAIYRTSALSRALDAVGSLDGQSMKSITRQLTLNEVDLARESTDDVDTWDDAGRFGIRSNRSFEGETS